MLNPRVIPCLLVHNKGLVKTVRFNHPKYVGDPLNAVRIFNEKSVDELIVLDIDASVKKIEPDYSLIKNIAAECRMPICYGGGIKTVDQAKKIISLGVEKVALSSAAIINPKLVSDISREIGGQSVVIVLDVKKKIFTSKYEVWINNARINTRKSPFQLASELEEAGAGEIVINSITCDGEMSGYDLDLAEKMRIAHHLPMTVLGGAGRLEDIGKLISKLGIVGASAGSLFVFKGPYKAVLINYPNELEKNKLFNDYYLIDKVK